MLAFTSSGAAGALKTTWTVADLLPIAEEAASIPERCSESYRAQPATELEQRTAQERFARWEKAISEGDPARFYRRLEWLGLDPAEIHARIARVHVARPDEAPSWLGELAAVLNESSLYRGIPLAEVTALHGFYDPEKPVAFEHVLGVFVRRASAGLEARVPAVETFMTRAAHRDMQQGLLAHLSEIAGPTLLFEFSLFRSLHRARNSGMGATLLDHLSQQVYEAFLQKLWAGHLYELLQKYPVLARLLARGCEQWAAFYEGFIRHLQEDGAELAEMLGSTAATGPVTKIHYGLSDRHHGGKSSLGVEFQNGSYCVYKPKNIDTEKAYYEFLTWLNAKGAPLPFKIFRGVHRADHGWCELVQRQPCNTAEEVERHFERAGALVCLIYVVEGNDCHAGNLIAHGEYPVLIDMECLFQHRTAVSLGDDTAVSLALEQLWDSVLRTHLLPRWGFTRTGEVLDNTGLGHSGTTGMESDLQVWKDVNTDAISTGVESKPVPPGACAVWHQGEVRRASDHLDFVVRGFREMYDLLVANRRELVSPEGPLKSFERLPVRYIYRPTRSYAQMVENLTVPKRLRSGVESSLYLESLVRSFLRDPVQPMMWPLIAAEHQDLLDADIPLFWSHTDHASLFWHDGSLIPDFFRKPSLEAARERIESLGDRDREWQVGLIHACFEASYQKPMPGGFADRIESAPAEASPDLYEAAARSIAEEIRRVAIVSADGTASWMTMTYHAQAERWTWGPMGMRMFDGVTGPALFLAAMEHVTGGAGFRDLAEAAFLTAARCTEPPDGGAWLFRDGIGAGVGGGSLLYAFAHGARLLSNEALLDAARRVAGFLPDELIHQDKRFDVMAGAAGGILALLTLYALDPTDRVLDLALACGDHLVASRTETGEGCGWKTIRGRLHSGFSHGVAGIGYALSRLAAVTGERRFSTIARESYRYENRMYNEAPRNWTSLLLAEGEPVPQLPANSWCHGATGITLGRIGSVPGIGLDEVMGDIERGAYTTAHGPASALDQLCCGNLGRASVLLTTARRTGRQDWEADAHRITRGVLARAHQEGRYAVGSGNGPYQPALFQGMAGIGYHLLRLAHPESLPDILLWE